MDKDKLTKERILDSARERMIRFGYRKVTMDEIAEDLAMSKNTIYKHFQSKVEIATELFRRLEKQINEELSSIEESNPDPLEVIAKDMFFIRQQLAPWFEHFLGDIQGEIPHLYAEFMEFRNEKIADLQKLLQKSIKMGKLRAIHPAVAVRMYLGAIDQILNPQFLQEEKLSFAEALDLIIDIWSHGILIREDLILENTRPTK